MKLNEKTRSSKLSDCGLILIVTGSLPARTEKSYVKLHEKKWLVSELRFGAGTSRIQLLSSWIY
jgi:hypothetical protein